MSFRAPFIVWLLCFIGRLDWWTRNGELFHLSSNTMTLESPRLDWTLGLFHAGGVFPRKPEFRSNKFFTSENRFTD